VQPAKILIVDDQPLFRRALRLALAARGYDISEADSGREALTFLRQQVPDLILVDWLMPNMDGMGLCRSIRSESNVPIIIITSRRDGRNAALAAGANDYVSKPFVVDELLTHIRALLIQ
jgi:DNA-binding response OmpR family regulator